MVYQTEIGVEQQFKDHSIGNQCCHRGQKHADSVTGPEFQEILFHQNSQDQGQDHHNRHLDRQIDKCIAQGLPEHRVPEHGHIVVDSAEQVLPALKIIEAQRQRFDYRIDHEHPEQDYHRQ